MRLLAVAIALTLLCACAAPGKAPSLVEARPGSGLAERVANAAAADPASMAQALRRSLDYVRSKPQGAQAFGPGGPEGTWAELSASLEHMLEVLPRLGGDPGLLEREFVWREVCPEPLMTGS